MNKLKKLFSSLSFRIISFISVLLIFFSLVVSIIGLMSFSTAFKREYSTTSYHMASTACTLQDRLRLLQRSYFANYENPHL